MSYLSETWITQKNELQLGKEFIIGGTFGESGKAVLITNNHITVLPEIACPDHEEADTRIFCHLAYAVNERGRKRVVISCTDTDVIVLSMYYYAVVTEVKEIWIEKNDTYLPIHTIVDALSSKYNCEKKVLTRVLLSCYVLSGCDTTSYPYKRGKRTAALVALEVANELTHLGFCDFCETCEITEDILGDARLFFVRLYGRKDQFNSLDTLRQHMFASSNVDLRTLPPTEDAFVLHVKRSLYQIGIYHRAHRSHLNMPPAQEYGRILKNGKLECLLKTKMSKPDVKNTACKCKTSRCQRACSCARAGVPCFVGCLCLGESGKCARVQSNDSEEEDEDTDD